MSPKKYNFKQISIDDHIKIYDGLPTIEKLKILEKKILSKNILKNKHL